ncbi:hypothetical protein BC936DRAFT_137999 [Jimgerdemannia flammicorona]|uniref:Cupredoxin n=1 Tax=Jimgerdemannia flammicorona TaxID=994334 RepID=A0A433DMW8_9FUNG|nr:hypothetical protein BC936DRAFT_137999 [Jimgerdemannia flammicorona]
MQRSFALLLVLAFVTFASAANIAISVGSNGLTYTPSHATVRVGDVVTWTFTGELGFEKFGFGIDIYMSSTFSPSLLCYDSGTHTVTQGSAIGGCTSLAGGFASPTQSSGTFSWTLSGTGPIRIIADHHSCLYSCYCTSFLLSPFLRRPVSSGTTTCALHCGSGMVGSLSLAN